MLLKSSKTVILVVIFVVEEPEFKFEAPKFSPKVDLPKASEIPTAKLYLEKRGLDPTKFLLY